MATTRMRSKGRFQGAAKTEAAEIVAEAVESARGEAGPAGQALNFETLARLRGALAKVTASVGARASKATAAELKVLRGSVKRIVFKILFPDETPP